MSLPVVVVVVDGYDFGLAKRGPGGDKMYTSSRMISIGARKNGKINDARNLFDKCLVEI